MEHLILASYFVVIQPAYLPSEGDVTAYRDSSVALDRTPSIYDAESVQIVLEDGEYVMYINGIYHGVIDGAILSNPEYSTIPFYDTPVTGGS